MEFTEQALILKTGRFREYDMWVRCLTPSRGVLSAFAFGGSVSRRRFCGCLEALNLCRFRFVEARGGRYLQLAEGDLLERHNHLKANPERLGMAANCAGFVQAVESGREGAREAFDLLTGCLRGLDSHGAASGMLPVLFRAALTFAVGYAPRLDACQGCGKTVDEKAAGLHNAMFFDVAQGALTCAACRAGSANAWNGAALPVGGQALGALAHMCGAAAAETALAWDAPELLDPPPAARREVYDIVEAYVAYHLGLTLTGRGFARAS